MYEKTNNLHSYQSYDHLRILSVLRSENSKILRPSAIHFTCLCPLLCFMSYEFKKRLLLPQLKCCPVATCECVCVCVRPILK